MRDLLRGFGLYAILPFAAGCIFGNVRSQRSATAPQGITSELHRQNLGKVVFAATHELKRDAEPTTLVTKTSLDGPLSIRAFFAKPASELIRDRGGACVHDGYFQFHWEMRDGRGDGAWAALPDAELSHLGREQFENSTTLRLDEVIGAKSGWPKVHYSTNALARFLDKLPRGQVPLQIRFIAECKAADRSKLSEILATGEIAITLDDAGYVAYLKNSIVVPSDELAHRADAAQIVAEAKRTWTDGEFLWARVPQREWTIRRNGLGVVESRGVTVLVALKKADGCVVHAAAAIEDATGGGAFVEVPHFVGAQTRSGRFETPDSLSLPCAALLP